MCSFRLHGLKMISRHWLYLNSCEYIHVSNVCTAQWRIEGDILLTLVVWAGCIFFISTDCEISRWFLVRLITLVDTVVTTLRVWVVCNRSRFILVTLLILVAIKAITFVIYCIMISTRSKSTRTWNVTHCAYYTTRYLLFSWLYSGDYSSAWFFFLRSAIRRFPGLVRYCNSSPDRSQCTDVFPCHSWIHQAVVSDVSCNGAVPAQPLYEPSGEGGNNLLFFVCLCLDPFSVFSSVMSSG